MKSNRLIRPFRMLTALAVVFSFTAVTPAVAADEPVTIHAEGYGLSSADALMKAKRNAVEQGIGTVLMSQTEVANFELQKDVVLSRTVGAVKKYRVLTEKQLPDKSYYTEIEATVSIASIKSDLAALHILLESMDRPRVMVMLAEDKTRVAENTIIDFLNKKSFEVVDPAVSASLMRKNKDAVQTAINGDASAVARLGAAQGAEYLIVGSVTKTTGQAPYNMISGQAAITARVVNCSTGRVISSASETAAFAHISEAIAQEKATERAAQTLMDKDLFEKIITAFQNTVNNGIILDVTITNVNRFNMQAALKNTIGNLTDTVSVVSREFGNGMLKLTVQYKGSADTFAGAVDGLAVNGQSLSVTAIKGNNVTARLDTGNR